LLEPLAKKIRKAKQQRLALKIKLQDKEIPLSSIRKKECERRIFFEVGEAAPFAERGQQPN